MNVNDFLNLKDEMEDQMEESVTLKRRSQSHGASSLDNELRVVMNHLREEVNNFRRSVPHQRMAALEGEVYIIDSVGKFMYSRSSTVLTRLRLGSLFSSFPSDPML